MLFAILDVLLNVALPGTAPLSLDYLAYDAAHERVWVPAGNSGSIGVIDTRTLELKTISGEHTAPSTRPGRPPMGPSSVTVAKDRVYVGNRADRTICAFDGTTRAKGACATLDAMPDGLAYVAKTHELWATTPATKSLAVIDEATMKVTRTITVAGEPEGYAVDDEHGRFYTNLEDGDRTLAIDMLTHRVVATYEPKCGDEGPRGLAIDSKSNVLFVACTNGVVALDLAKNAAPIARFSTGAGVDDLGWLPARKLLYVASGADGKLTIVHFDGAFTVEKTVETAPGARNAVVDRAGTAYVADPRHGRVIVVKHPSP